MIKSVKIIVSFYKLLNDLKIFSIDIYFISFRLIKLQITVQKVSLFLDFDKNSLLSNFLLEN